MTTTETPTLFHGVPQHEWIGRMVKGQGGANSRNKARNPVRIIAFLKNGKVEIRPVNHGHNEIDDESNLHPWWAKNSDLREKYKVTEPDDEEAGILDRFQQTLTNGISLEQAFVEEKETTPEIPDGYTPVATPPSIQAPARRTIRKLHVDPGGDLSWMDDYKTFNEATASKDAQHDIIAAALKELQHLDDLERLCLASMETKGVQIEWDTPEPVKPESRPVRVGDGAPGVKKTPFRDRPSPDGRLNTAEVYEILKVKMAPGVSYLDEDLARICGAPMDNHFRNRIYLIRDKGGIVAYRPEGATKTHYKLP